MHEKKLRNKAQRPSFSVTKFKNVSTYSYEGSLSEMPLSLFEDKKSVLGLFLLKGTVVLQFNKKRKEIEIINNRFLLFSCPGKMNLSFKNSTKSKFETLQVFIVVFDNLFFHSYAPTDILAEFDNFHGSFIRKTPDFLPAEPGLLSGDMKSLLLSFFIEEPTFKKLNESYATTKAMRLINYILEELFLFPDGRSAFMHKEEVIAQKAIEMINSKNNIHDITLSSLAEELKTNTTTLKQSFRKIFGTTVSKYFTSKLMAKAQEMLTNGKKVGEVAEILGYSNISHFSKAYTNYYRLPPGKTKS